MSPHETIPIQLNKKILNLNGSLARSLFPGEADTYRGRKITLTLVNVIKEAAMFSNQKMSNSDVSLFVT